MSMMAVDSARPAGVLAGPWDQVIGLAVVAAPGDQRLLAVVGGDTVWLCDPESGRVHQTAEITHTGGSRSLTTVRGAGGNRLLATRCGEAAMRVWDPATGELLREHDTGHRRIHAMTEVIGANGSPLLAVAGTSGVVALWDPATGEAVGEIDTGHREIWCLATIPTAGGGCLLASGGGLGDFTVRIGDPASGRMVHTELSGGRHHYPVSALSCITNVDGRSLIASGATDGEEGVVWLWDPVRGELVDDELCLDHTTTVTSIATTFGGNGATLVAAAGEAEEGTILLWNPASGDQALLSGHEAPVTAMTAVPVGDRVLLASGDEDGVVRLWDTVGRR